MKPDSASSGIRKTPFERIDNAPKPGKKTGRLKRKAWPLSKSNKKKLKKAERARLRKAKNKKVPVDLAGSPNYCGFITRRATLI